MEARRLQTDGKKQNALRPPSFTYYELPLAKDTLLSRCPLEECGRAGLEATCLARQPGGGDEEEEGKEEEGREEVEEEAEEEELAGKKAQRLRPSGLCQEPFKSCAAPHLQESRAQGTVKRRRRAEEALSSEEELAAQIL